MHLEGRIETTIQAFSSYVGFDTAKSTAYSTNENYRVAKKLFAFVTLQ
jgi:hypothetical protein